VTVPQSEAVRDAVGQLAQKEKEKKEDKKKDEKK
jgi:Arc/MetJ-type ribon-helix-helix transcriptional regulator